MVICRVAKVRAAVQSTSMTAQERPYQPSLPWRLTSAVNIGIVGFLSRSFLYALNRTQTRGLERFLEILDGRKDERTRTRGLVTGELRFLSFLFQSCDGAVAAKQVGTLYICRGLYGDWTSYHEPDRID